MQLEGRVALVTGGSGGIGPASDASDCMTGQTLVVGGRVLR
jgi:NADP-dependent 3-hydroxy acid dehydrogenase YdfG